VRQHGIGEAQKHAPKQKAEGGRHPDGDALRFGHVDRWGEQGPKAGGNHHAGRKPHHRIEQPLVDASGDKDN